MEPESNAPWPKGKVVAERGGLFVGVRIENVVIESVDPKPLVEFWAKMLESPSVYNPDSGWGQVVAGHFSVVIKPVSADELPGLEKGSRVHMDIAVDDLVAETKRVLALGASVKRGPTGDMKNGQCTVFADIDGNAFCLFTDPAGKYAEVVEMIRNGTLGS